MKVKLAAQTLSSGVADAIEYLCQKGESSFQNSEETVYFIRQIDRLFDILNSRIPFSKGYKSPIHPGNINTIKSVFTDTTNYLKTLKFNGIPLILSGRKMFLIGFIVTMTSTLEIAYELLGRSQSPLKYILTYKMSQDHLELFFGCIRSRGGSNNNPNCSQFKKTLRQLLFTKNITVESGNCSNFVAPGGDALDFRSEKRCIIKSDENLDETEIDNYLDILSSIQLIEYTNEILDYIAGYIVKNICKKVVCPYCIDLLVKSDLTDHSYVKDANFTSFVNRGKLKIVSSGVSLIIQELEKSFQAVVVINKKLHNNVKQNIVMLAKKNILNKSTLFFFPNSHPITVDIGSPSHEYSLFTALSQSFVNIRMRHYAKEINSKQVFKNKSSLRQKLTKLILFNNI
uniref:THAP domain-containing protein 9 n=2 Tax=Schizaphis graminum TaxID=13262 RepID=A0A2S2NIA2_SCHGA